MNHGLTLEDADRLLDAVVDFPDLGAAFERVRPLTDFRKDDAEARVLYICRRTQPDGVAGNGNDLTDMNDDLFVLKCKVQCVSPLSAPHIHAHLSQQSTLSPGWRLDHADTRPKRAHQG